MSTACTAGVAHVCENGNSHGENGRICDPPAGGPPNINPNPNPNPDANPNPEAEDEALTASAGSDESTADSSPIQKESGSQEAVVAKVTAGDVQVGDIQVGDVALLRPVRSTGADISTGAHLDDGAAEGPKQGHIDTAAATDHEAAASEVAGTEAAGTEAADTEEGIAGAGLVEPSDAGHKTAAQEDVGHELLAQEDAAQIAVASLVQKEASTPEEPHEDSVGAMSHPDSSMPGGAWLHPPTELVEDGMEGDPGAMLAAGIHGGGYRAWES